MADCRRAVVAGSGRAARPRGGRRGGDPGRRARHRRRAGRSRRDGRLHRPQQRAGRCAPTTTARRRSRRPPSSSRSWAAPASRSPSIISTPTRCKTLAERIRDEHGHIDVLVNDIWGAELLKGGPAEWNTPIWEHDLDDGLRILRLADRHPPRHLPSPAPAAHRQAGRPARRGDRRHGRLQRDATTGSRCSTTWPRSP